MAKILTFSGAHCVGKTTLISDVLAQNPEITLVPSCSTTAFNRMRDTFGITSYNDIDAKDLRGYFQTLLPVILYELIAKVEKSELIIVDRWLADIMTYTLVEMGDASYVSTVKSVCDEVHRLLLKKHRLFHYYITTKSAEGFAGDVNKFRGSSDRYAWEHKCLTNSLCNAFLPGNTTIIIEDSSRMGRVEAVNAGIRRFDS